MLDIELGTTILGDPKATYELGISGPMTSVVVDGYDEDTYESVARSMVRALALLGFRGEVRLFYDGMAGEEEKAEIFAAIESLKGTLEITDAYAAHVADEELKAAENMRARFDQMALFMKQEGLRRGLTKEQRERMTVGEALEPQEEE